MPWVLGYGSMMDAAHAARVLKPLQLNAARPFTLSGFERHFDVLYGNREGWGGRRPHAADSGPGPEADRPAVAYLGVHPAPPATRLRGLALQVDAAGLARLDEHEFQYRRWPVPSAALELDTAGDEAVWMFRASRGHDAAGWAPWPARDVVIDRRYWELLRAAYAALGGTPDAALITPAWPLATLIGGDEVATPPPDS